MIDKYTKVVLTLIAISLSVLAAEKFIPTKAQALGTGCGDYVFPCTVEVKNTVSVEVLE